MGVPGWYRGSLRLPKNTHSGCRKTPIIENIHRETYILGWEKHPTAPRLAKRQSILILTGPVVKTGFNWSLLVDWWSIEVVDWVD